MLVSTSETVHLPQNLFLFPGGSTLAAILVEALNVGASEGSIYVLSYRG